MAQPQTPESLLERYAAPPGASGAGLTALAGSPRALRVLRYCIVGLIGVVYLASLSRHWLPGGDSALYLLLGRSLAAGQGYTLFGQPSAFVPPGFPAILAGAELLGLTHPLALNAIMLLLAGVSLVLAYLVVRQHVSAEVALWVVLLFALCNHMHDASVQVLSDVPCVLLVGLGLWLWARWSRGGRGLPELGALALVAAGWVRLVALPLAVGAAGGMLIESIFRPGRAPEQRRTPSRLRGVLNAFAVLAGVALTAAFFYARYQAASAAGATASYMHHVDELAERSPGGLLSALLANLGEAIETLSRILTSQRLPYWLAAPMFGAPVVVGMIFRLRRGQWIGPAAAAGYLGAIVLFRAPIARYLLVVGFLLILFYADGLLVLLVLGRRLRAVAPQVLAAVLIALTAANLPRDLRRIYWVHHPRFPDVYRHGRSALYDMAKWLKENAGPQGRFVSSTNTYALALLSGVSAAAVPKRFLMHAKLPGDLLALLEEQRVKLVIFYPDDEPKPFADFRAEALKLGRLRLLYDNGEYAAYECLPAALTTSRAAGAGREPSSAAASGSEQTDDKPSR